MSAQLTEFCPELVASPVLLSLSKTKPIGNHPTHLCFHVLCVLVYSTGTALGSPVISLVIKAVVLSALQ